jgi:hypothetical protein
MATNHTRIHSEVITDKPLELDLGIHHKQILCDIVYMSTVTSMGRMVYFEVIHDKCNVDKSELT